LTNIPQAELIITPPANVALLISPIENLPLAIALVIKVAIQLPDIDKTVFIMIIPLKYGWSDKWLALDVGQYIHKNNVPSKSNILDV